MLNIVQNFVNEHNMINKGDRIVVGVSGGADSVCLFHVLLELTPIYNLTLYVVHVNHGIRGEEADEDEAYVKKLCKDNKISFVSVKADVPGIAKRGGLSEEEAGRKIRYEAFHLCYKKNKCNKIAIAHNRNDNAETILFHLFRGSGIKGLTGIPAVRDSIIRPLLDISREEIEYYLEQKGIGYQTDRTNLTQDYSRNKIRHQIISFAKEEINSKAIEHIVKAAETLAEIDEYLEKNIKIAFGSVVIYHESEEAYEIYIEKLRQEDLVIQKGIIRRIFELLANQLKDIEALHVELVLALTKKQVGKVINLPHGILAVRDYHTIIMKTELNKKSMYERRELSHSIIYGIPAGCPAICKVSEREEKETSHWENELPLKTAVKQIAEQESVMTEDIHILQTGQILHIKLIKYKKSMIIPRNGCTKWFDYDKIKNTVSIRTRKEGDFIQIDSAGSRKKIKSLFIDEKVPRNKRDLLPLLADGAHIMWVIGGRMSEAYKVSEGTKVILEINLDGGKQDGE